MEAFTCDKCQTIHDYSKITISTYCDSCKQLLVGHKYQCTVCMYSDVESEEGSSYHKTCVTKLEGAWYCPTHREKKQKVLDAANVIQKYAEAFWEELGGKVQEFKKSSYGSSRMFRVNFDVLWLTVNLTPVSKNGDVNSDDDLSYEIIALKHEVSGIKNHGSATYQAGIHSHQDALEQVASAMIRSLRSKKSALTVERNNIKANHSGLPADRQKDWYGSAKNCLKAERGELSLLGKKRKKINELSNALVAKLESFKATKAEPVLV